MARIRHTARPERLIAPALATGIIPVAARAVLLAPPPLWAQTGTATGHPDDHPGAEQSDGRIMRGAMGHPGEYGVLCLPRAFLRDLPFPYCLQNPPSRGRRHRAQRIQFSKSRITARRRTQ